MLIYLLLAQVLEVGVVKVHVGFLEPSDPPGTILKQFPFQNCTWKSPKRSIFDNISITFLGP